MTGKYKALFQTKELQGESVYGQMKHETEKSATTGFCLFVCLFIELCYDIQAPSLARVQVADQL